MDFPAEDILLLSLCMFLIFSIFWSYGFYKNQKVVGSLSIYAGTIQEKNFLLKKTFYRLGRMEDPDSNIQIKSSRVSKHHGFLKKKYGKFYIVDNNSKNGIYVNGHKIESSLEFLLDDQDEISLGGVYLRFYQSTRDFTFRA